MNILETHNVVKRYAAHTALDNVSINVPDQSIFGLLGPNGAGKTSLIRIITQITAPDSGEIIFNNSKLDPSHIAQIGYLPEERGLYKKMKVGEHLLYLAQLKGLTKNEAMDKLKIWFIKFDIKTWWDKKVEDLSKGMQQKIQFIATVLHQPKLIILDEPFSGFDPINANIIKDEILELRKQGSTIIFSTHRMESVEELCDYIALINNSKVILNGSTKEVRHQFKTNTYYVEGRGNNQHLNLPEGFIQSNMETLDDDYFKINIKIPSTASSNELIQSLIKEIEIRTFKENIPSMNEIFISSVNGENEVKKILSDINN